MRHGVRGAGRLAPMDISKRARLNARKDVRYHLQRDVRVLDRLTMQSVLHFVVFGKLPKTSTGKIYKFELRKAAGLAAAIDV